MTIEKRKQREASTLGLIIKIILETDIGEEQRKRLIDFLFRIYSIENSEWLMVAKLKRKEV